MNVLLVVFRKFIGTQVPSCSVSVELGQDGRGACAFLFPLCLFHSSHCSPQFLRSSILMHLTWSAWRAKIKVSLLLSFVSTDEISACRGIADFSVYAQFESGHSNEHAFWVLGGSALPGQMLVLLILPVIHCS
jgi:hypothetical protein